MFDLSIFNVDCDLKSNSLENRRNDENQHVKSHNLLCVSIGLVTRTTTKRIKKDIQWVNS
jgi:hypothetical protein